MSASPRVDVDEQVCSEIDVLLFAAPPLIKSGILYTEAEKKIGSVEFRNTRFSNLPQSQPGYQGYHGHRYLTRNGRNSMIVFERIVVTCGERDIPPAEE